MTEEKETCCDYRRKIVVAVTNVLPEDVCGVPDSVLADLLRFDLEVDSGKPVLAVRFCPWCGKERTYDTETRITDINLHPMVGQTYSKCGMCGRGFEINPQLLAHVCPGCGNHVCPDCECCDREN